MILKGCTYQAFTTCSATYLEQLTIIELKKGANLIQDCRPKIIIINIITTSTSKSWHEHQPAAKYTLYARAETCIMISIVIAQNYVSVVTGCTYLRDGGAHGMAGGGQLGRDVCAHRDDAGGGSPWRSHRR